MSWSRDMKRKVFAPSKVSKNKGMMCHLRRSVLALFRKKGNMANPKTELPWPDRVCSTCFIHSIQQNWSKKNVADLWNKMIIFAKCWPTCRNRQKPPPYATAVGHVRYFILCCKDLTSHVQDNKFWRHIITFQILLACPASLAGLEGCGCRQHFLECHRDKLASRVQGCFRCVIGAIWL